jgi:hypothetical protein
MGLAGLKLLSTGYTWYNSLGFYENDADYFRNETLVREYIDRVVGGKTVRETFGNIFKRLMEIYNKKSGELDDDELDFLRKTHKKVGNKFIEMKKELSLIAHEKLSNLVYRGTPPVRGVVEESIKKRKRSDSTTATGCRHKSSTPKRKYSSKSASKSASKSGRSVTAKKHKASVTFL